MSENTELIELVLNRDELNHRELEKYFNIINGLIKQTAESLKIKYETFGIMNVDAIITEDDFLNLCWDMVEGSDNNEHRLIDKLKDISFPDDNRLKGYLRKTFETLLIDLLHKKNPGFQTRKKQLNRVLKPLCVKRKGHDSRSKGDLWQLKNYESHTVVPPDSDELKKYSSEIAMPEISYRKSEDAQRGSSIKDDDMKAYLLKIFDKAGGAIYEKDLDALLNHIFGFHTISFINDHTDSNVKNNYREYMINIRDEFSDFVIASNCYRSIAEKCLDTMDEELKQMVYYLYVKGMDQGKTAKKMVKSSSSITGMKDSLVRHIKGCIEKSSSEILYEEGEIIFELIKELINENRQVL
ncbi:MAG: hypothetical protein AB7U45_13255 [Desulfamplus sp.]